MTMGPAGPPRPPFAEALADLLSTYADLDNEHILVDMERQIDVIYDKMNEEDDLGLRGS